MHVVIESELKGGAGGNLRELALARQENAGRSSNPISQLINSVHMLSRSCENEALASVSANLWKFSSYL